MKQSMGLLVLSSLAAAFMSLPTAQACEGRVEYSALRFYIEYNNTGEDVGVQLFLDGEPWKVLTASKPDGSTMLNIRTRDSLRTQGMTELFWESAEPSLAEVPLDEFLARWPEGDYEFEGETIEGECIEGVAVFTHVIPAAPVVISPQDGDVIDPDDFTIEWEPVTTTIDGSPDIEIIEYEVIVGQIDPKRELSIHLSASVTSVKIPAEFFEQDNTLHVFEILAIEAGHNQTITAGEFLTEP